MKEIVIQISDTKTVDIKLSKGMTLLETIGVLEYAKTMIISDKRTATQSDEKADTATPKES